MEFTCVHKTKHAETDLDQTCYQARESQPDWCQASMPPAVLSHYFQNLSYNIALVQLLLRLFETGISNQHAKKVVDLKPGSNTCSELRAVPRIEGSGKAYQYEAEVSYTAPVKHMT